MKTKILFLTTFMSATLSYSQNKLVFSYDSAGNQTMRNKVCINCASKSAPQETEVLAQTQDTQDTMEEGPLLVKQIVAYPNPTTNLLQLEWINTKDEYIKELNLFTLNGKLLSKQQLNLVIKTIQSV